MHLLVSQLLLCFCFITSLSSGADTMAVKQSLSGNHTLVSSGGNFELGFFKPGKSSNYYIGIWYKKVSTTPPTVVWVANRETPVADRFSSELKIVNDNIVLLNESRTEIWSTNVVSGVRESTFAVLLDDGNFVLRDESNSSEPIWQSFDYPTHTWLPGSKLLYNKQTNYKITITSWRNTEDPAVGRFSLELDPESMQLVAKWNNSELYWDSGPWNGESFSIVPEAGLNSFWNFSVVEDVNNSYLTYSLYNTSLISRFILTASGDVRQLLWTEGIQEWVLILTLPRTPCSVYARCGAFATCSQLPLCNCLTGFKPRSESDWNLNAYSGGCVRKTSLNCGISSKNFGFTTSFLNIESQSFSSLIENAKSVSDESECKTLCLKDCACYAYAFTLKRCRIWNGEVLNLETGEDSSKITIQINIKVATSDLPRSSTKINIRKLIAGIVSGFVGLVFLCSIAIVSYRRRVKRRGSRGGNQQNLELQYYDNATNIRYLVDLEIMSKEDKKNIDVPFFEHKSILAATDNFSFANKLGQGGFGPVYKGKLPGGAEIAVKRLSNSSRQGVKEFKTEVMLIAKLQHRNLVRLLGYSMREHEMILLYEYMPNKSLDRLLFDRTLSMSLNWAVRFDIILGIARGLLYLHQDSRLRIIHRDLKTSNILLDEDMNPKISDFGLAKIVKGRETEASTNRVIGTYGYMSPEYAFYGLFSIKSDVFSFGVVVLEIISGKRNTGYYQNNQALSLLRYAWNLWKENKPLDLIDRVLRESCSRIEVLRCIIIGLLCVQDDPNDRPTMMNVVLMLGTDIESLPDPKEPAFVSRTRLSSSPSSSNKSEIPSINQLTITEEEGR